MVEPLLLLKLLHCRKKCRLASHKDKPAIQATLNRGIKKNDVDVPNICRICLKEGAIPIFNCESTDDFPSAFSTILGIEINEDDIYPKKLCESCLALLQGAIMLRKTAQESDQFLKRTKHEHKSEINDDFWNHSESNALEYDAPEGLTEETNYYCKRCEIEFTTYKEYSDHRLSDEHENKRVVCPVCHKSYTATYYKKHLAIHKPDCPFVCDICGKKFIVQGQFTRHRLTHFYKLPFKCGRCPYRGRFSESLKMHMRSHTGERPYQCSECAARFVNKSNLNKHMLTHKREHDYKCESCGRGFYTKKNLEMHIKVDHSGIKDHICNICHKAFGYRKQMMKHQLKVHKRQKLRSGRMPLYLQVEKLEESGDIST